MSVESCQRSANKIVDHAGFAGDVQAGLLDGDLEFVRRDELVPLMGAARQPAQDVFGADDRQREAFCRAVERGDEHKPAGLHHRGGQLDEQADIGDMLDHFHGENDVEAFAGFRQRFGGGVAVVDGKTRLRGVSLRHRDVALRRIGADDRRAEPRQRLAENAAAAADIEDAQAGKAVEPLRIAVEMRGGAVADVSEPDRIELVQRRHRPVRVPPLPGEAREPRDFVLVDGAGRCWFSIHASPSMSLLTPF